MSARERGFLVLANPSAGGADGGAVGQVLTVLAEAGPTRVVTLGDDADVDAALEATAEGLEGAVPVVVGGDGTLHRVVARIHALGRSDLAIGLVPAGTGNDLARAVGLPLEAAEAARAVLGGRPRARSVMTTPDGSLVVCNAIHLGIGPDAVDRATTLKPALGRFAFPVGAAVAAARLTPLRARLQVDGRPVGGSAHLSIMVLIGDGFGGGFEPAGPTGSAPLLLAVPEVTALRRVVAVVDAARGRLDRRRDVVSVTGARIKISAIDGPTLTAVADGEVVELASPLVLEHHRGAWHLLVPDA